MKILHVLNSVDPENGGTVEAVRGIAEATARLGHEVIVASTGDPALRPGSGGSVRWDIFPLRSRAWRWSPALLARMPALAAWSDAVHLHTVWDFPVYAGARTACAANKPFVLSPHGMLDDWSLSQRALKKTVYMRLAGGDILGRAAAIHFTSAGECRGSERASKYPRFICHLGVDAPECSAQANEALYAREPRLKGRRFVLFLGRLHYKKNPQIVIESFEAIRRRFEDVYLVMAGPGEDRFVRRLKERAVALGLGDRVLFTGMLPRPLVAAAFCLAQVFVLPSMQENFGLSVAEAMSAGCPVIVSRAVNLSDDIESARAGIVCPPEAGDLERSMTHLLSDETARREMGRNGQILARDQFTWERAGETLASVYDNILNQRRSSAAWVSHGQGKA